MGRRSFCSSNCNSFALVNAIHRGKTKAKKEVLSFLAVIASSWSIGLLSGYGGELPCQREITKRKSQLNSIQLPTALLGGVSRNRKTISADPIRYKSLWRQGLCLPISNGSPEYYVFFFPFPHRQQKPGKGGEERRKRKK